MPESTGVGLCSGLSGRETLLGALPSFPTNFSTRGRMTWRDRERDRDDSRDRSAVRSRNADRDRRSRSRDWDRRDERSSDWGRDRDGNRNGRREERGWNDSRERRGSPPRRHTHSRSDYDRDYDSPRPRSPRLGRSDRRDDRGGNGRAADGRRDEDRRRRDDSRDHDQRRDRSTPPFRRSWSRGADISHSRQRWRDQRNRSSSRGRRRRGRSHSRSGSGSGASQGKDRSWSRGDPDRDSRPSDGRSRTYSGEGRSSGYIGTPDPGGRKGSPGGERRHSLNRQTPAPDDRESKGGDARKKRSMSRERGMSTTSPNGAGMGGGKRKLVLGQGGGADVPVGDGARGGVRAVEVKHAPIPRRQGGQEDVSPQEAAMDPKKMFIDGGSGSEPSVLVADKVLISPGRKLEGLATGWGSGAAPVKEHRKLKTNQRDEGITSSAFSGASPSPSPEGGASSPAVEALGVGKGKGKVGGGRADVEGKVKDRRDTRTGSEVRAKVGKVKTNLPPGSDDEGHMESSPRRRRDRRNGERPLQDPSISAMRLAGGSGPGASFASKGLERSPDKHLPGGGGHTKLGKGKAPKGLGPGKASSIKEIDLAGDHGVSLSHKPARPRGDRAGKEDHHHGKHPPGVIPKKNAKAKLVSSPDLGSQPPSLPIEMETPPKPDAVPPPPPRKKLKLKE
ncbi:unnamed protein product, partial [Discosporangium mesarthrocarpum]